MRSCIAEELWKNWFEFHLEHKVLYFWTTTKKCSLNFTGYVRSSIEQLRKNVVWISNYWYIESILRCCILKQVYKILFWISWMCRQQFKVLFSWTSIKKFEFLLVWRQQFKVLFSWTIMNKHILNYTWCAKHNLWSCVPEKKTIMQKHVLNFTWCRVCKLSSHILWHYLELKGKR